MATLFGTITANGYTVTANSATQLNNVYVGHSTAANAATASALFNVGAFRTHLDSPETVQEIVSDFFGSNAHEDECVFYTIFKVPGSASPVSYFLCPVQDTLFGIIAVNHDGDSKRHRTLLDQLDLLCASGENKITLTYLAPVFS